MSPQLSAAATNPDLEIKDARIIFEPIWEDLIEQYGSNNLRFPKEIILLGGAPGSGKGTNTAFIAKTRGLTSQPIVMSALLDTPAMKRVKDAGHMIGDREVLTALLKELLKPEQSKHQREEPSDDRRQEELAANALGAYGAYRCCHEPPFKVARGIY